MWSWWRQGAGGRLTDNYHIPLLHWRYWNEPYCLEEINAALSLVEKQVSIRNFVSIYCTHIVFSQNIKYDILHQVLLLMHPLIRYCHCDVGSQSVHLSSPGTLQPPSHTCLKAQPRTHSQPGCCELQAWQSSVVLWNWPRLRPACFLCARWTTLLAARFCLSCSLADPRILSLFSFTSVVAFGAAFTRSYSGSVGSF